MKSLYRITFVAFLALLFGCQQQQQPFSAAEKATVQQDVQNQFNQLVAAINRKDARAWSKFYSQDNFSSAIVGTDYYDSRSAWVDLITKLIIFLVTPAPDPGSRKKINNINLILDSGSSLE